MRALALAVLCLCACADSAPPPAAPTAPPLEVPPLPPPKSTAEKPVVKQAPLPAAAAEADDDESDLPRDAAAAEALFQDARKAMSTGDLAKARALYLRSLRLDRAVGTLLNLGECEARLGDRQNAIRHYKAAYDEATKRGQHERAAFARDRLAALMAGP